MFKHQPGHISIIMSRLTERARHAHNSVNWALWPIFQRPIPFFIAFTQRFAVIFKPAMIFFCQLHSQCANHFDHLGFLPKIATNHTVNLAKSHTDT